MPFKIITIPFDPEKECFLEQDLNDFCLNKKLKGWQAGFFVSGEKAYWSIFMEYDMALEPEKADDSFSEPQRLLYARLREWRKGKAQENGVPVYIVATNTELKQLVVQSPYTIEALKNIKGFGKKKIERYGKEIISLIKKFHNKK
jgi:superfamily II DNA helicase RecQ